MNNNPTPILPFIQERLESTKKEIKDDLFLWVTKKKHPNREFDSSLRDNYWGPYLDGHVKKIIDTAFATNREIAAEHVLDPSKSVNDSTVAAERAIKEILNLMADYDQKMRGKGYPRRVSRRDVSEEIVRNCKFVRTRAENEIKLLSSPKMKTITLPLTPEHDLLWYFRNCHKSVYYWLIPVLISCVVFCLCLGFAFGRNNTLIKLYDLIKNPTSAQEKTIDTPPQNDKKNNIPTKTPAR